MTIAFLHGDIFSSRVDAIVCPVNTMGVMGAGLSCEIKRQYPQVYKYYYQDCKKGSVSLGSVKIYTNYSPATIILPTKLHPKDNDSLQAIYAGLLDLARNLRDPRHRWEHLTSIALPAIGCSSQFVSLDWGVVRSLIEQTLSGVSQRVLVYEPSYHSLPESDNYITCKSDNYITCQVVK